MAKMNLVSRHSGGTTRNRLMSGTVSALALAVCYSGTASAQTAAGAQTKPTAVSHPVNEGLTEIIVTAQKREQRLQDVPVAVTAVSGNTLQANRVENVTDLNGLVPGLLARANTGGLGQPSLAMRGVNSSASAASQDRETSQYVDGVYIGSGRGAIFDLPDTERIEVLRGPQGTLFGRNATSGAVSVVTRDPSGKFGARQDLTVGNLAQIRTRTSIDTPQFGPFSAYFTYVHDEQRGDVRNLGAGVAFDRTSPFTNIGLTRSPKWLGGHNKGSEFAAVRFQPSDDFKMTYKFDNSAGTYVASVRSVTAINPNSFLGGLFAQIIAAQPAGGGAYGPVTLDPSDRRPDAANNGWTQDGYQRIQGHSLTSEWRVSDQISLKNISAYRKARVFGPATIVGLDGLVYTAAAKQIFTAPLPFLGGASYAQALGVSPTFYNAPVGTYFAGYEGNNYAFADQYSSELQANYNSRLMSLTVGAIYFKSKEIDSGLPGANPDFGYQPLYTLLPLGNIQDSRSKTTSEAAYAQADIHLTHQLDLQVGGRVTHDKKVTSFVTGGAFVNGAIVDAPPFAALNSFPSVFKVTKPTWLASLNYKPVKDTLIYAKASTGFLSGGSVGPLTFKPETVLSYEGGVKTELFDRRLRINVAVWEATYKHNQLSQSGSTVGLPLLNVVVIDAGTLKSHGIEAEVQTTPFEGMTLGGQFGYTKAKLKDVNPILLTGIMGQTRYQVSNVPTWTANVNAQYITQPLFDEATMLFRIDANYQGRSDALNDPDIARDAPAFVPYRYSPARWILNGRVALRNISVVKAKGEIGLWVKNLTNDRSPLFPFPFGDGFLSDSFEQARTFGVDFIVKY